MTNKKIIIIAIIAILIIWGLIAGLKIKSDIVENENIPSIEEVEQTQEELTNEEEQQADSKEIQTTAPADKKSIVPKVKKEIPVIKYISPEEEAKAIQKLNETGQITQKSEPESVVIIDKEYKMKSKDKYSFK